MLHQIPRVTAEAYRLTARSMTGFAPAITPRLRSIARGHLVDAARNGRVDARQLREAGAGGDIGIARLMSSRRRVMPRPVIDAGSFAHLAGVSISSHQSRDAAEWMKSLVKWGYLDAQEVGRNLRRDPSARCAVHLVMKGWNRLQGEVLESSPLARRALPNPNIFTSILPWFVHSLAVGADRSDPPDWEEGQLGFAVENDFLVALVRLEPADAFAIDNATGILNKHISFAYFGSPRHALEMTFPTYGELVSDLGSLLAFSEDGSCTYDLDAAIEMICMHTGDDDVEYASAFLPQAVKYIRWDRAISAIKWDRRTEANWSRSCNTEIRDCVRAMTEASRVLEALPRLPKRQYEAIRAPESPFLLIPQGCGLDRDLYDAAESFFQSDFETSSRFGIGGNSSQLRLACVRLLNEAMAINYAATACLKAHSP